MRVRAASAPQVSGAEQGRQTSQRAWQRAVPYGIRRAHTSRTWSHVPVRLTKQQYAWWMHLVASSRSGLRHADMLTSPLALDNPITTAATGVDRPRDALEPLQLSMDGGSGTDTGPSWPWPQDVAVGDSIRLVLRAHPLWSTRETCLAPAAGRHPASKRCPRCRAPCPRADPCAYPPKTVAQHTLRARDTACAPTPRPPHVYYTV